MSANSQVWTHHLECATFSRKSCKTAAASFVMYGYSIASRSWRFIRERINCLMLMPGLMALFRASTNPLHWFHTEQGQLSACVFKQVKVGELITRCYGA